MFLSRAVVSRPNDQSSRLLRGILLLMVKKDPHPGGDKTFVPGGDIFPPDTNLIDVRIWGPSQNLALGLNQCVPSQSRGGSTTLVGQLPIEQNVPTHRPISPSTSLSRVFSLRPPVSDARGRGVGRSVPCPVPLFHPRPVRWERAGVRALLEFAWPSPASLRCVPSHERVPSCPGSFLPMVKKDPHHQQGS